LAFHGWEGEFSVCDISRWCTQQALKHVKQRFHRDNERLIPSQRSKLQGIELDG
jgi:hypothetical protein